MNCSIFKADLRENENDIKIFWRNNFPNWPQDKYSWFYLGNPHGQAQCWIAKAVDEDKVIGTFAIFPKRMYINGRCCLTAIFGDLGVDPKYRMHGVAKLLQRETNDYLRDSELEFLYGTPNDISEKVAKSAGVQVIGKAVRMVKVLRTEKYISRFLKIRFLSRIISKPVDMVLGRLIPEYKFGNLGDFGYEILADFDNRFDVLWNKANADYPLMGEKTSAYMHWRFTECPFKEFKIFALTGKADSSILGYIVYRFEDQSNILISDFFMENPDDTLRALLAKFCLYLRTTGIHTVSLFYFGNDAIVDKFREAGFSLRPDNRSIVTRPDEQFSNSKCILEKNNWHFLEGDNDT